MSRVNPKTPKGQPPRSSNTGNPPMITLEQASSYFSTHCQLLPVESEEIVKAICDLSNRGIRGRRILSVLLLVHGSSMFD